MKRKISKSEETSIKAQQSGRRLSGNQQRELTRIQTNHPLVEETSEAMKQKDLLRPSSAPVLRRGSAQVLKPRKRDARS